MAKGHTYEVRAYDRKTRAYRARILADADVAANGYTVVAGMRGLTATRSAEGVLRVTLPNTHTRLLYAGVLRSGSGLVAFDAEDVDGIKTVDFTFQVADTPADQDPDGETIFVEIVVQDGTRA